MQICLIVTIKFLFIALAVYLVDSPTQQMTKYTSPSICLKTDTPRKLCAQCLSRDQKLPQGKGYQVISPSVISVLKIKQPEKYLSCQELLQFINFEKDAATGTDFHLQSMNSIQHILKEIDAAFAFQKSNLSLSEYLVESKYNQFVVYRWMEDAKEGTVIQSINTEYYQQIKMYILYGFNFVLIVVLAFWLEDHSFINNLPTPVKFSLAMATICIELTLFGIFSNAFHFLARLFILNLGLCRFKVNNFKIIGIFFAGLVLTYFSFTTLLYTAIMIILIAYYGKDQSETRSVKFFLVIFYTLLLLNYSYWYQYSIQLNDLPSIIIEYCALTFIPTGIFLIPNQKKPESYTPSDPQIRAISLSGFDQEDEMNI